MISKQVISIFMVCGLRLLICFYAEWKSFVVIASAFVIQGDRPLKGGAAHTFHVGARALFNVITRYWVKTHSFFFVF